MADGLPVTEDYNPLLLVIGGDPDGGNTCGSLTQEWHDSGSGSSPRRYETIRISCYVCAWTGDVDVARTAAALARVVATSTSPVHAQT